MLGDIYSTVSMLQTPRYLTPEQYKAESGKEWPDNAAVYVQETYRGVIHPWIACSFRAYKNQIACEWIADKEYVVICALFNDGPPK
jgi:hypothetical protein